MYKFGCKDIIISSLCGTFNEHKSGKFITPQKNQYRPPFWAFNGHLQTILPSLFRTAPKLNYQKKDFIFSDTDFTQLNWLKAKNSNLVLIIPGMESTAEREYVRNTAALLYKNKHDVLIPDHRSCGDRFNSLFRSYHSGNSSDLREIIDSIAESYNKIHLIGFSLGGNILLKYLGEKGVNKKIETAFCISTPLDLEFSSLLLEKKSNAIYRKRFVKKLKTRLLKKAASFPKLLSKSSIKNAITIKDLDDLYTSKAHGFKDADEYYHKNSSHNFIKDITVATHIINAQNDPMIFLRDHEISLLNTNPNIHLHLQKDGGHVGFPRNAFQKNNFYEMFIINKLNQQL